MKQMDKNSKSFEEIKHIDENGVEFWYARELMIILEYKQWRRFESVINKAKESCKNSDISVIEHFANVGKLSKRANNAEVEINDYKLSRYACYLIAQNGDSRKKVIALAQTYFAVQTRKQEITEKEYSMLTEDEKRFYQRDLTRKGNYSLNQTAKKAGVKNFDKFHNAVVLEQVAKMAAYCEQINPKNMPAPQELQDKHYYRKHGANAYYGQKEE